MDDDGWCKVQVTFVELWKHWLISIQMNLWPWKIILNFRAVKIDSDLQVTSMTSIKWRENDDDHVLWAILIGGMSNVETRSWKERQLCAYFRPSYVETVPNVP